MIDASKYPTLHGNKQVYVYTDDEGYTTYKLVRLSEARRDDLCIVTCAMCDYPTARLDHLFPCHNEFNRCKMHDNTPLPELRREPTVEDYRKALCGLDDYYMIKWPDEYTTQEAKDAVDTALRLIGRG